MQHVMIWWKLNYLSSVIIRWKHINYYVQTMIYISSLSLSLILKEKTPPKPYVMLRIKLKERKGTLRYWERVNTVFYMVHHGWPMCLGAVHASGGIYHLSISLFVMAWAYVLAWFLEEVWVSICNQRDVAWVSVDMLRVQVIGGSHAMVLWLLGYVTRQPPYRLRQKIVGVVETWTRQW